MDNRRPNARSPTECSWIRKNLTSTVGERRHIQFAARRYTRIVVAQLEGPSAEWSPILKIAGFARAGISCSSAATWAGGRAGVCRTEDGGTSPAHCRSIPQPTRGPLSVVVFQRSTSPLSFIYCPSPSGSFVIETAVFTLVGKRQRSRFQWTPSSPYSLNAEGKAVRRRRPGQFDLIHPPARPPEARSPSTPPPPLLAASVIHGKARTDRVE